MKPFLKVTVLSFVFLTGCSAANMAGNNEGHLLQDMKVEAAKKCSKFGDLEKGEPNSRKNVLKFHHCIIDVADKTLIPYSAFPDIWLDGRAKGLRLAKQYHDGKIDYDEYKAGMAEGSAEVIRKIQARLGQMQQQQMQASKDLQNLGNQMIMQDQMMRQQNTPRTVNCSRFGNQVRCTEF